MRKALGLAVVAGVIGSVLAAAPAHAGYSVTAKASNTGPDAGTPITISGAVSGGGAARKVVEQYWNGSRWVSDKTDTSIPGGKYSVSITRRAGSFGTGKYRAVAVDAAGRILGTSPTVTVGWFTWMNLAPQEGVTRWVSGEDDAYYTSNPNSFDSGALADFTIQDGLETSAAGVSYPQSILFGWERASHHEETSIYGMRYSLHRLCTDVRFSANLEARNDPAYGGSVSTWVDGAQRQHNGFQPGTATAHHRISVRGGNNVEFRLGLGTSSTDYRNGFVTVGTPQARCKGALPAKADR